MDEGESEVSERGRRRSRLIPAFFIDSNAFI
jgi:hypothetical protein